MHIATIFNDNYLGLFVATFAALSDPITVLEDSLESVSLLLDFEDLFPLDLLSLVLPFKDLRAVETHYPQHLPDILDESRMVNCLSQLYVAKMSRAVRLS
jgi:hypothetical protein